MNRSILMLAGALAVWSGALPAQAPQDATLGLALRLVTEGRGDSARTIVRQRLASLSPRDTAFAEALYVAGAVAEDADSAVFYFRRVSVEYSQSGWADRSLLRLGQLAYAGGDVATAQRSMDRILSDYPLSNVRPHAAFWAGRIRLDQGNAADACRLLRQAAQDAGEDVELANRVGFYLQRCDRVAAAPEPRPAPPAGAVVFSVQVAAVRQAAQADELMRSMVQAGYQAHVFRDTDGFLKVRVGRFPTRAEAQRLQQELRGRFGGQPFVVEER